jgi:hypothetical protein
MSTHVLISKKPSGHNLAIKVQNPGSPEREHIVRDNEFAEVLVYGDGYIHLAEVEKPEPEAVTQG